MDTFTNQQNDPRVDQVRRYRPIGELMPAHWQTGDLLANGISQRLYRTGGDKPPLVLLHGILEGALVWLPTAQALEADYDVIMLDTRGHGHSARIGDDYTPQTLAADVVGALQALQLNDVNLLGFSQGASTALFVADSHPELVTKLMLAGMPEGGGPTGAIAESPGYQAWLDAFTSWLEGLKTQNHEERLVASLAQLPPGAPVPSEEEYVAWVENSANLDLDLVRLSSRLWRELGATIVAMQEALKRIDCPTLVMRSSFMPYSSGPLTVRSEESHRSNMTTIFFENTGHVIYRDRFAAFVDHIRRFLEQ